MILDMGFLTTLREAFGLQDPSNLVGGGFAGLAGSSGVVSPWSDSSLQEFVWSDIFGIATNPVTRAEAMTVAAVVNGRARIIQELAGRPLRALDANGLVANQPTWLYRTNTGTPPWFRTAQTLDDWIFYGHSLWAFERSDNGTITDAARIPYERWELDQNGGILVDKKPVTNPDAVMYLPGPMPGLLNCAGTTIRASKDLEKTWAGKARNPIPAIVLTEKEDNGMTDREAKKYVDAVAKARQDPNGAVMFVPYSIAATFEGTAEPSFAIEARNAAKLDIASFLNLPAAAVEAAQPKASLNYETDATTKVETTDRMAFWSEPFEALLSMDNVCPRGQRIRFDFGSNPTAPTINTGPYTED
ncbi:hypothetical protein ALI44B_04605 [Leifsonia sp. ALI-44-B]|nr:hypothetical protein ALI44B_04605 [Leifsonia sp. ALI-44-B]